MRIPKNFSVFDDLVLKAPRSFQGQISWLQTFPTYRNEYAFDVRVDRMRKPPGWNAVDVQAPLKLPDYWERIGFEDIRSQFEKRNPAYSFRYNGQHHSRIVICRQIASNSKYRSKCCECGVSDERQLLPLKPPSFDQPWDVLNWLFCSGVTVTAHGDMQLPEDPLIAERVRSTVTRVELDKQFPVATCADLFHSFKLAREKGYIVPRVLDYRCRHCGKDSLQTISPVPKTVVYGQLFASSQYMPCSVTTTAVLVRALVEFSKAVNTLAHNYLRLAASLKPSNALDNS